MLRNSYANDSSCIQPLLVRRVPFISTLLPAWNEESGIVGLSACWKVVLDPHLDHLEGRKLRIDRELENSPPGSETTSETMVSARQMIGRWIGYQGVTSGARGPCGVDSPPSRQKNPASNMQRTRAINAVYRGSGGNNANDSSRTTGRR